MTLQLDNQQPKVITPPYGDIKFEAVLVLDEDSARLQLKASLELKYLVRVPRDLLDTNKKLDLREDTTKVQKERFFICEELVDRVERDLISTQTQLDGVKDIEPDDPEKRKRLEDNRTNAKGAIKSAKACLKKAKSFRKNFLKRLRNGQAEIEAILYANVSLAPKASGIERVEIIVFSTKKKSKSGGILFGNKN